jgi:hypothetical protein
MAIISSTRTNSSTDLLGWIKLFHAVKITLFHKFNFKSIPHFRVQHGDIYRIGALTLCSSYQNWGLVAS